MSELRRPHATALAPQVRAALRLSPECSGTALAALLARMPTPPRTTVLFVDDDSAWREVLDRWLTGEGLRAVGLARGEWISHAIEHHRPDVLLLGLPGQNSLGELEDVRRRWPTLPVIVMTAVGGKQTAELALHLGATGYLDKPFPMDQLRVELRRVTRRPGPEDEHSPCA